MAVAECATCPGPRKLRIGGAAILLINVESYLELFLVNACVFRRCTTHDTAMSLVVDFDSDSQDSFTIH